jgi:hypothetical protein
VVAKSAELYFNKISSNSVLKNKLKNNSLAHGNPAKILKNF